MRLLFSLQILALSFLVADVAANTHGSPPAARRAHDSVARRAPGDVTVHNKRFGNTRFTFYDVGLGACGEWNVASDFIVALNTPQYGSGYPGPHCFKTISISYGGKSTTATIMDQCPGCPYGGLDLSRGLFDFFAPESAGVLYGEWHFADSAPDPTTEAPKPTTTKTTKTPTPTPTPTTTKEDPPTTTSPPPPSTTSSKTSSSSTHSSSKSSESPSSSSSSSSSSINYSSGAASNLAVPTSVTISDNVPHNLLTMNQAIVAVGGIIVAGERAE